MSLRSQMLLGTEVLVRYLLLLLAQLMLAEAGSAARLPLVGVVLRRLDQALLMLLHLLAVLTQVTACWQVAHRVHVSQVFLRWWI